MRHFVFTIFLLVSYISSSQNIYQVELNVGSAFQSETKLNNQEVEKYNAFEVRFGSGIHRSINDKLHCELGVFGKYNRCYGEIKQVTFISNSLKLQLPILLGYKLHDKWAVNVGLGIENNRDKMDFKKEDNLRYDFLSKIAYKMSNSIQILFYSNWALSSVPNIYAISNPKKGLNLGVVYQLNSVSE